VVEEGDSDTRVDGNPAVLPDEHVGGGRGVEQASEPEPADHAAADPLGERGQIGLVDRSGRQERRRYVSACFGSSRHEDAVGHARVEVHVVVERRAEAVEEGDATEPRAGGCGGVTRAAWRGAQESFDLVKKDFREGCDGGRAVGEEAPQSLGHRREGEAAG
jgi:hypothetical protein